MRICIITDNKKSHSSKKFEEEALSRKDRIFFATWKGISFNGTSFLLNKKIHLKKFDSVILRSSSTSPLPLSLILDYCVHNNIRLLNKSFYLRYQSVNKLRQQSIFKEKKIPCLKTVYGEKQSYSSLKETLGVPFVSKLANGSLGRQVFKINSKRDFDKFTSERKKDRQLYLFQKFYPSMRDYRVFIVGRKVFGPVKRTAPEGEWLTNIKGSRHERAEEKKQVIKLAKAFTLKTNIEFAGLDILIDSSGKPRMIEINTMACFKIFDRIFPEINIAKETLRLLASK